MNADMIAHAIVAGAKETGADPIDVALGNDRSPGYSEDSKLLVRRARAYAGRALDHILNLPDPRVPRPVIAKLVGVNKPSYTSYFGSLDCRTLSWWSDDAYGRVISAVADAWVRATPIRAPVAKPKPPVISPGQRFRHMPPTKEQIGVLERSGFRPAPEIVKGVVEDDKRSRGYVPVGPPIKKGDDFLRRAVENTQKLTPPPED